MFSKIKNLKTTSIIFLHMFTGWALCGATIGIGRSMTTLENTLIIHAVMVPIIFFLVAFIYFKHFSYTGPLRTAFLFLFFAVFMDAAVVAPLFEKSYQMFTSLLGTWIPFLFIFGTTLITGLVITGKIKPSPTS